MDSVGKWLELNSRISGFESHEMPCFCNYVFSFCFHYFLLLLLCWCFKPLSHILGHFGRGQLIYPQRMFCRTRGSIPRPSAYLADAHPIELLRPTYFYFFYLFFVCFRVFSFISFSLYFNTISQPF